MKRVTEPASVMAPIRRRLTTRFPAISGVHADTKAGLVRACNLGRDGARRLGSQTRLHDGQGVCCQRLHFLVEQGGGGVDAVVAELAEERGGLVVLQTGLAFVFW